MFLPSYPGGVFSREVSLPLSPSHCALSLIPKRQSSAVVMHQKLLSFSLWVLCLQLLCALHGTFCAHFRAEMTRDRTSCFPVSDESNWIIVMLLNATFSQVGFCFVCRFQVDSNLDFFFLIHARISSAFSLSLKFELWYALKIQLQLLIFFCFPPGAYNVSDMFEWWFI